MPLDKTEIYAYLAKHDQVVINLQILSRKYMYTY